MQVSEIFQSIPYFFLIFLKGKSVSPQNEEIVFWVLSTMSYSLIIDVLGKKKPDNIDNHCF